ncbi:MAG TPA: oligosaccharide flippase family protein [Ktedonobacteraceae bacterium]|nr:oligosaccharide flippase family protein [Ktedonobacteraceae bacterium]
MIFKKEDLRHPWVLARSLVKRARDDSLLRNSIYIIATNVVTSLFGYLFWVVATHIYSANDVGLGAALLSTMALASTLSTLGIDSTLVLTLPRRASGYAWSLTLNAGMAMGILSGMLAGAIVVLVLPLFGSEFALVTHFNYALALIAGVPLMTVSLLLDQTFIAERAAHNKLIRNLGVAVLKVPLLVLPVILIGQIGALGILLPWVLSMGVMVAGAMFLILRLRRSYCLATRGIVGQARSMLSLLAGNQFIDLGGILPYYLLPVFVAARLSPADNAYYYTTLRLAEFFTMGSYAVSMSLFAEGSHAIDDLPRKVRSTILIISMIIGPGMLFCFFAGHYILLLFGPAYAQHGLVLFMIYVASTVPDSITNVYLTVLRVQRRLIFAGMINVSMGALTLILTWVLLPGLGIAGPALAFIIAQTAGSLVAGVDLIRMRRSRHRIDASAIQINAVQTEQEGSFNR